MKLAILKSMRIAAATAALVFGVLALAGCAAGSTANDMEIAQVIYVRTGGDMDKADVYAIRPDLTLEHTLLAPNFPDWSEFPWSDHSSDNVDYLQIPEDAWQSIVLEAKRVDFMTLPEKVETSEQVSDGSDYYIRVETTDGSHVSGGYEAGNGMDSDNRRFGYLRERIEIAIGRAAPQEG